MSAVQVHRYLSLLALLLLTACGSSVYQHNSAGNRLFDQGAYQESLYEYRQAQVEEPELAEPFYNASNAYNRMGDLDAVQAQTLQILEKADPDLAAQAWYNLGNAFFDAQNFTAAVDAYKEALRLTPDDLEAKHNLELALQMKQQQDEQQEQDQPQTAQTDSGENQPNPEETSQPAAVDEEEAEESQESPKTGETPETKVQPEPGEMTPEQAAQLLEVLLSGNPTLQEYLNQVYEAPGPMPGKDW